MSSKSDVWDDIEVYKSDSSTTLLLADYLSAVGVRAIRVNAAKWERALFISPFNSDYLLNRITEENELAGTQLQRLKTLLDEENRKFKEEKGKVSGKSLMALTQNMKNAQKSTEHAIRVAEMIFASRMRRPERLRHMTECADAQAHELWSSLPRRIQKFEKKAKIFFDQLLASLETEGFKTYILPRGGAFICGDLAAAAALIRGAVKEASEQAAIQLRQKHQKDQARILENWKYVSTAIGKRKITNDKGGLIEVDYHHDIADTDTRKALIAAIQDGKISDTAMIERLSTMADQVRALKCVLGIDQSAFGGSADHPLSRLLLEGGASESLFRALNRYADPAFEITIRPDGIIRKVPCILAA